MPPCVVADDPLGELLMPDIVTHTIRDEPAPLILKIEYGSPITAIESGRLFTSLADDYQRLNRDHTLLATQIRQGSILAILQDAMAILGQYATSAADVASAANSIKKFAGAIKEFIGEAKDRSDGTSLYKGKRRAGIRSCETMLNTALKSGGEVSLSHKTSDGEMLSIKVTSDEAIRIREESKLSQLRLLEKRKDIPRLTGLEPNRLLPGGPDDVADPQRIVEGLAAIAGPDGRLDHKQLETAHRLIAAFAAVLKNLGSEFVLGLIADDLEAKGIYQLAEMVRSHIVEKDEQETRLLTRY